MSLSAQTKSERIELRASAEHKQALQNAARIRRKSVTEYIMEAALADAAEVLAARTVFTLDEAQWAAFQAALDAPTAPRPRLEKLFDEPSVLE